MPSGVFFAKGRESDFITSPARALRRVRTRIQYRMDQVLREAVEEARQINLSFPKYETGDMNRAITYRVTQDANYNVLGQLGFLDEQEFYFFLQTETGFRHWRSGEFIEPSLALEKAAAHAFEKLLDRRY